MKINIEPKWQACCSKLKGATSPVSMESHSCYFMLVTITAAAA